jgi:hypothetical protein
MSSLHSHDSCCRFDELTQLTQIFLIGILKNKLSFNIELIKNYNFGLFFMRLSWSHNTSFAG